MKKSISEYCAVCCRGLVLAAALVICGTSAFCADWKAVHELANGRDLAAALRAAEKQPQSVEALYRLALVYMELFQNARAQEVVDRIMAIAPELPQARWVQAELLRRRHDIPASEMILRRLISQYPDFTLPYLTMGFIRYTQARFEEAAGFAAEVISRGSKKTDSVHYSRAYVLYGGSKGMVAFYGGLISKLVNGPKVLSWIRKAEQLRSNNSAAWWGYGSYYLLAPKAVGGNINKAQMYLERTIAAEPLFPDPYVRLAQVYLVRGDRKNYQRYLEKALELDPQNELALDIKTNTCNFVCVERGIQ